MNYFSQTQFPTQIQARPWFVDWLPALAWSLIPLSFSVFTEFGTRPAWVLSARWLGFGVLAIHGLLNLVARGRWRLTSFDYLAFIVFSLVFAVSALFSDPIGISKAVSCLLVYLYLTWGIGSLTNTLEGLISIAEKLLFVGIAILGIGLIGNLSGLIPPSAGAFSGIYFNPNGIAALAVIQLPLSIWFLFRKSFNIIKVIPLIIVSAVIVLSEARSPWLGIIAFSLYTWLCQLRHRRTSMFFIYTYLLGALGLILLAYIFLTDIPNVRDALGELSESLADSASSSGGITSYRTSLIWPLYLAEITKSLPTFLFGHGWGSEEVFLIQQKFFDPTLRNITNVGTAHNAYIGLTYQIGFIGSMLTFGSIWILIYKNLRDSLKASNKVQFQFQLAVAGSILVGLCTATFETGVYNMGAIHAVIFWFAVYTLVTSRALAAKRALEDANYPYSQLVSNPTHRQQPRP